MDGQKLMETNMKVPKPQAGSYHEYYDRYIKLVDEDDLFAALAKNHDEMLTFFSKITDEQGLWRYAEGKWSIKELLQHLIDTERIFCSRALRFARKDETPLPGYDHEKYVPRSKSDRRPMSEILAEFDLVRQSTLALFRSFDTEMMQGEGMANRGALNVSAIGYITAGHCRHHCSIIRERYLSV
jgi:hypothetical protein